MYDYKVRGIIIRSRARWSEKGEKNTKYVLNLEKRNKSFNSIKQLILDNNTKVESTEDILETIKNFYKGLYTKDDDIQSDTVFNNLDISHSKLSEDQSKSCEGLLTLEECSCSLFSMSLNKSPGSHGIPVEFYRVLWDEVGPLVVNSFNYAFQSGFISDEQGRACLTLIPKENKDNRFIKNWRPIALLNVDYKIAAKCMATRLKTVLTDLIDPEQTGFLKGRFIGENVRLILDLISYCNDHDIPGALIFLDYEKAFDRLDWGFIQNTLTYFNFGSDFRLWVRTLYNNTSSCVVNNGFLTEYFRISRDVRQGCPLSPYLLHVPKFSLL